MSSRGKKLLRLALEQEADHSMSDYENNMSVDNELTTVEIVENKIQNRGEETEVTKAVNSNLILTVGEVQEKNTSYWYGCDPEALTNSMLHTTLVMDEKDVPVTQADFVAQENLVVTTVDELPEHNNLPFNTTSNISLAVHATGNDVQTSSEDALGRQDNICYYETTGTINNKIEVTLFDEQLQNELIKFDNNCQKLVDSNKNQTTETEQAEKIHFEVEESENCLRSSDASDASECNETDLSDYAENVSNSDESLAVEEETNIGPHQEVASNSEPEEEPKKKRPRKGHGKPEKWVVKKNQQKREAGAAYKGLKKNEFGRWQYSAPREERKLGPTCNCAMSKKKTKIQCNVFSEDLRRNIFNDFWKLKWNEKKVFVRMLIDVKNPVDTKNKKNNISRRNKTLVFHLKKEKLRIRVCKKMFLSTLGIRQWSVLHWVENESNEDKKSQTMNRNKTRYTEDRQQIRNFLNMLPKVESHYCRSSSNKLYLEPIWRSKTNLFRQYEKDCIEKNIRSVKFKVFEDVFNDMNLSIFLPKKDQCDICIAFNTKNMTISQEQYDMHQRRKTEARREKEQDKLHKKFVYTMDLQSVLLCPVLKASAIYYKTKLIIHNFTIFNLKNSEGYCYLWDESEGSLNANEFASILCSFISEEVPFENGDEIIFFSDGCGYQNRNITLSNALLSLAIQCNITITQKILEKGHTQMECDSMHATIERRLRNQDIYTPSGYIDACKHARIKPKPYHVQYLHHDFFRNYSQAVACQFYKSLRPGNKAGDPTTSDLRAIRYNPDGAINFKLHHTDDWQILPQRKNVRAYSCPNNEIPKEYNERLKIKSEKWNHLQSLKTVLEKEHHHFYDSLPHY